MTNRYHFFLFYFFFFFIVSVSAQSQSQRKEIIDQLTEVKLGQGRVMVYEDNSIKSVLGRSMSTNRTIYSKSDGEQYEKMRGFKIQVFSGNNQRTSKNEANSKQQMINQAFPEHESVVAFDSPFWRLRVGNFRTRDEASRVLDDMKKAFTSFGKEMYIVVDEVKIPIN